jgi:hypothetical protein
MPFSTKAKKSEGQGDIAYLHTTVKRRSCSSNDCGGFCECRLVSKQRASWRRYNVTVVDIWEFNTSQVCSKCHYHLGVEDLKCAAQPHFVRRCLNPSCHTTWDRGHIQHLSVTKDFTDNIPGRECVSQHDLPCQADPSRFSTPASLSAKS